MLRAMIFDFNGVIADDETPHFLCFQQALAEVGIRLTKEEYYGTYLGMDERNCLAALLTQNGGSTVPPDQALIQRILDRKAALFRAHTAVHKPELFPGVVEFVKAAGARYRLAIASGGRKEQIEAALRGTPIERDFAVIISADETTIGKPDPTIYLLTLKHLNEAAATPQPAIKPDECLVIEDSLAGIRSAHAAGMRVLAVSTTYPIDALAEADLVLPSLTTVSVEELAARLQARATD